MLGALDRWSPLGVFLLALAFQLPTFDRSVSLMDEGHILQFADLVRRGGELYRDAALLPLPGAFYLLSLAFELFGPSIRVARWLVVVEFAALAALVFALMRRLVPRAWAWASLALLFTYKVWAFPHWLMYSYSTTSLLLLALGLYAFVVFLERGDRRLLATAGLALGLGILCKQDYGGAVWIGLNAVLVLAWRSAATPRELGPLRLLGWLNLPVLAVGGLTALHFLRQGLFDEMLTQTLLNHLFGIATFEYSSWPPLSPWLEPQPMLRSAFGVGTYAPAILFSVDWARVSESRLYASLAWDLGVKLFFYAPYAIAGAGLLRMLWTRAALADPARRGAWLRELALAVFAASLLLALHRPIDYVHVSVLYWPLLLLGLVLAHAWLAPRPRLGRALGVLIALPGLALLLYSGWLLWLLHSTFDTPLRGERAGVFVRPSEEEVIGGAVDYMIANSEPGDRVAVLPYFPLLSFLAQRDAPHRSTYTFWPVAYIEDRERRIAEAIEQGGSPILVYHFTQWPQLTRMPAYAPELFDWLVRHYRLDALFSDPAWGYQIAGARRSPAPPGVPLLSPGAPELRLFAVTQGRRTELPEGRRRRFLRTESWPFRPVLALRPVAGPRQLIGSLAVPAAAGARVQTAIGVHPTWWFRFPAIDVVFEIHCVDGERRELLFERELAPHRRPADRGWHELELSLDRYAGRTVELEFSVRASDARGEVLEMGGFEIPRLLLPEDAPAQAALDRDG